MAADAGRLRGLTDAAFLRWLAGRLVKVYGESPNVDFVWRLREVIASLPPIPPPAGTEGKHVTERTPEETITSETTNWDAFPSQLAYQQLMEAVTKKPAWWLTTTLRRTVGRLRAYVNAFDTQLHVGLDTRRNDVLRIGRRPSRMIEGERYELLRVLRVEPCPDPSAPGDCRLVTVVRHYGGTTAAGWPARRRVEIVSVATEPV